jgi:hypothetical protein
LEEIDQGRAPYHVAEHDRRQLKPEKREKGDQGLARVTGRNSEAPRDGHPEWRSLEDRNFHDEEQRDTRPQAGDEKNRESEGDDQHLDDPQGKHARQRS